LSWGAQSLRSVHSGAALYISAAKSYSQGGGEPTRTPFGALDEPGDFGDGCGDGGNLRPRGVSADPIDRPHGGRGSGILVVLCAASVRGNVLGAAGPAGLPAGGPPGQCSL